MNKLKIFNSVTASALSLCLFNIPYSYAVRAADVESTDKKDFQVQGINVAVHTEDEIRAYVNTHAFLNLKPEYKIKPDPANGTVGRLNDEVMQNALNALNTARYIAGLNEAGLDEEYIKLAQAASDLNNANDKLTHEPEKPDGIPDDLYELGALGAKSSNISWSSDGTFIRIIMFGFMGDSNDNNISHVGHRRWCINPSMGKTGFGAAGDYGAMYAFDNLYADSDVYGVSWPAQNMPLDYFENDYAWSYSRGEFVDASTVKVTLTRMSDLKKWIFSSSDTSDGYFNVENSGYGKPGCIIFRPDDIKYSDGDVFNVTIEGLDIPVNYNVNFFALVPEQSDDSTDSNGSGEGADSDAADTNPDNDKTNDSQRPAPTPSTFSENNSNAASLVLSDDYNDDTENTSTVSVNGKTVSISEINNEIGSSSNDTVSVDISETGTDTDDGYRTVIPASAAKTITDTVSGGTRTVEVTVSNNIMLTVDSNTAATVDPSAPIVITEQHTASKPALKSDSTEVRGMAARSFTAINAGNTAVNVSLGQARNGEFANFYRINEKGESEFVNTAKIENGTASAGLNGDGQYIIMTSRFSDLKGDADNDGKINAKDATEILKQLAKIKNAANFDKSVLDFNEDGIINGKDAVYLLKQINGLNN